MKLRRQTFVPAVHVTHNRWRPITLAVAGLEIDSTPAEAQQLADALLQAIHDQNEGHSS